MGSKTKRRGKQQATPTVDQLKRNLEKGNYKQALKDAKLCYRQSPDQHRTLLECAYIGRAQQLARQGNRQAARGVVEDLLALGVREPSVEAALPELLATLGMLDRLRDTASISDERRAALQMRAADLAVLHPDEAPKSQPHLGDGARRIRAAIESLYQGDETAATSQIRGIASESPFADWRYFVRGLAAYYRHDSEQMLANWQRLDEHRFAAQIARPLTVMAGAVRPAAPDAALQRSLGKLDRQLADQSLQPRLDALQRALADDDWRTALQTLRSIRSGLRKLDAGLYQRLVRWLCSMIIRDGRYGELDRLAQIVDPLPLDPHWSRARALAREWSKFTAPTDAVPFWQKYVLDLQRLAGLPPAERDVAQGLVWHRLSSTYAEKADALRHCPCGASHVEEVAESMDRAKGYLEKCLALVPNYAPAYEVLATMYQAAGQPDQAAAAYRRALEHLPDDTDALTFLVQHDLTRNEPLEAQPYAQRLQRLKPLDKKVKALVWSTHVGAARWYARQQQFDRGRAEFDAADALLPDLSGDYDVLAHKAVFEMKAANADAARQLIERAQESLQEPTPLWLFLTIETTRYELPEAETWLYEKRWNDALKKKCAAATAGAMCKLMRAHLDTQQAYRCRADHVKRLLAYVRRCSRVKWRNEDLREVCEFLDRVKERKLLDKYVRKGQRQFPDAAYYHGRFGELELRRSPRRFNRNKVRKSLERAIELAAASNDPRDELVLEEAKRNLTFVKEAEQRGFRGPPSFFDPARYDDGDFDDDFDDGGIDDGPNIDASALPIAPNELMDVLLDMCEELGLDPEQVLGDAAAQDGLPNPFSSQVFGSRQIKKKKRKKKRR
jgi:Tfp pilus assembly protein PilF